MKSTKILVLYDEDLILDIVKKQLEPDLYPSTFIEVQNREDFLFNMQKNSPDIIVCGFVFPDQPFSAEQAIRLAQVVTPLTPVILLTNQMESPDMLQCIQAGVADIILIQHQDRLATAVQIILKKTHEIMANEIASEALQRAGQQWRATFDTMTDAICVTDGTGIITRANASFRSLVSLPWNEVIGHYVDQLPLLQNTTLATGFYDQLFHGGSQTWEQDIYFGNRWFNLSIEFHNTNSDTSTEIICIFSDITKQRQDQQELQTRAKWMQTINQFSREAVQQPDLENTLHVAFSYLEQNFDFSFGTILMNHEAEDSYEVVGISQTGKTIAEQAGILPGIRYTRQEIPAKLRDVNKRHGEVLHFSDLKDAEVRGIWNPIKKVLLENGITSILKIPTVIANHNSMIVYLGYSYEVQLMAEEWEFLRNMTEYIALSARNRRLYEELRQSYAELDRIKDITAQQRRMEAMGQIASGITHDINNTLVPISLYTEALLSPAFQFELKARTYLESIQNAINDIEGITSRLRTFYREEETLQIETIDIEDLFLQVIELTRPKWKTDANRTGIAIHVETNIPIPAPVIYGVPGELREALVNLIFNAVDALPEGGRIILSVWTERATAYLSVGDSGIGMTESQMERCLEPFYTTKGVRGSGLGLPGVYGVMQRHGGTVQIASKPNKGTLITLAFPLNPGVSKHPSQVLHDGGCTESIHILVVDDDPRVRTALVDLLTFDGHQVAAAENGMEAIKNFEEFLQSNKPIDLVMTDLGMEGIDGIAVAEAVKQRSPNTPVILLTGWGALMNKEERPDCINILLNKPPTMEKIRSALVELQLYEECENEQTNSND